MTENGESRIYAGIHFRSAVEDGIEQGNHIGRFVFKHALQSLCDKGMTEMTMTATGESALK